MTRKARRHLSEGARTILSIKAKSRARQGASLGKRHRRRGMMRTRKREKRLKVARSREQSLTDSIFSR